MTGHPPRDRVDGVIDLYAAAFDQQVDQLAQRVLCLRDRQPVAGTMITLRVREQDRHIRRSGRLHRPIADRGGAEGEPPFSAPKRMLINDRPIALAIRRVSRVPAEPTRVPATNSRMFSSR